MPRLDPLPMAEWSDAMKQATRQLIPPPEHRLPEGSNRPRAVGVLETFAHHPDLAKAYFAFNRHVLWGTTLPHRWRHLLIMRVAARRQCDFLYAQHRFQARDAGLTDEEIDVLAMTRRAVLADPFESALSTAADEIIDDGAISEDTWSDLAERLDAPQLLDVVFTVGCYLTIASFMRSVGLQVDPADLEALGEPT